MELLRYELSYKKNKKKLIASVQCAILAGSVVKLCRGRSAVPLSNDLIVNLRLRNARFRILGADVLGVALY